MNLLRLLVWLRFKLWWRSLTAAGRWVAVAAPLGLLFLLWPVWLAGAMGAWWAVRELRGGAAALVLGVVQMGWITTSVLAASAGQALAPRELLRYPVRPALLFGFNAAASVLEPATLVLTVPVVAFVVASFVQLGAGAGVAAALAALLSLALTVTALQLLVAVLERMLRTEWMRMLSRLLLALIFLGISWSYSAIVETELAPALARRVATVPALARASAWLERWPTIGAPAAMAAAPLGGGATRAGLGLVAGVAMLAALVLVGARVMTRGALLPPAAEGGESRTTGAVNAVAGLVPGRLANLVRFDLLVQARSPRGLLWVLLTPLLISAFYVVHPATSGQAPLFAAVMGTTTLAQVSLMLFAHYGPGIRTLHLLPVRARDVVLARNLTFAMEAGLLVLLLGALFAVLRAGLVPAQLPAWAFATLAMLATLLATGNDFSIRWPVRVTEGWGSRRNVSWQATWSSLAITGVVAVVLAGTAYAARWFVPGAGGDVLATALLALEAAFAAFLWWRSLDHAACAFVEKREAMIEALAKDAPAT